MLREKGHNEWLLLRGLGMLPVQYGLSREMGSVSGPWPEVWAVGSGWALQDASTWCHCWQMGLLPAEGKVESDMADKGLGNPRKLSCQMFAPPMPGGRGEGKGF